jgi:signal transduction histidine kinase
MSPDATPRPGRSLRWRLSFTYAGIALLTALVLGGMLVAVLEVHFSRVDEAYLRSVADRAARDIQSTGGAPLEQVLRLTAYGTNARVQALDSAHQVIADSGSPHKIAATSLNASSPGQGPGTAADGAAGPGAVAPPNDNEVRSDKVYELPAQPGSAEGVAFVRVSEAPSSGGNVMQSVIVAWAVAAAAALVCAAIAGYAISSRITRPVVALAEASDRMAQGDLGARADLTGSDEIGRLAGSFNQMAAQVEATVRSLQRFVSDAAHQLGTPLTALRADLEIAQDAAVTEDERRLLTRALTQEQRLEDLGSGLLQLSRLESPSASGRVEMVDLALLAKTAADAFASRAEQADLTLELAVPERGPWARADADRLRVAIENLLDNAVKFTPAGGTVQVGVDTRDGRAIVWVADDGPGIPPADRDRVFERFYRARNVADRPGSGLGLAIVHAAAEACGGSARLAETDVGTRIEVCLPRGG